MKIIVKEWQSRIGVMIDRIQIYRLKYSAKQIGIKHTHLVRILIDMYLNDKIDVSEYQPSWTKQ